MGFTLSKRRSKEVKICKESSQNSERQNYGEFTKLLPHVKHEFG